MEQRKSKQDREQKLHPIQCSATVFGQLAIDSAHTNRQLLKNPDCTLEPKFKPFDNSVKKIWRARAIMLTACAIFRAQQLFQSCSSR